VKKHQTKRVLSPEEIERHLREGKIVSVEPILGALHTGAGWHRCHCDVCGYQGQRTGGSGVSVLRKI